MQGIVFLLQEMNAMRIFLIGFMGSGKSHTGRRLAAALGYLFQDLDDWIAKQAQRSIPQIFEQDGELGFRKIEQAALHDMAAFEQVVVACGGGTPCFFDNMSWMNQNGTTVFLQTPVEILLKRLQKGKHQRPLLKDKTEDALLDFIQQKLNERLPYYEKASIIQEQRTINQDVAADLLKYFTNMKGH